MNGRDKILEEKEKKIIICAKLFLEENYTIKDIKELTGYSTSSIQRYLNDDFIIEKFGQEVYDKIKKKLSETKHNGNVMGGINSQTNNEYQKDKDGKFIGSKPRK